EEWRLNFTSIAFAGSEALAGYRYVVPGREEEAGGLLVYNEAGVCVREDELIEAQIHGPLQADERSCWHMSASADELLAHLPSVQATVLSKVAGIPGGGAVAAGPAVVMERQSAGAAWQLAPVPLSGARNISALAAYREAGSGALRAVVSVELDPYLDPNAAAGVLDRGPYGGDVPLAGGPGQPPPLIPADPLPDTGYVLRQTAGGWEDMEHLALPVAGAQEDLPIRPSPVFALLVAPTGAQGLAVGGQSYDQGGFGAEERGETSAALRFPAASHSAQAAPTPLAAPPGQASFVVGGEARCGTGCGYLANQSIAPDVWLTHALQTAAQIEGARGFLYLGSRSNDTQSELDRFEELLGATGGTLPVYVEPLTFDGIVPRDAAAVVPCTQAPEPCAPGTAAYSFTSTGASGGSVRVIVLDFAGTSLETAGARPHAQEEWLAAQLATARGDREPAIVMGRDALGFRLPDQQASVGTEAIDASAVARILVEGEASAYLFDYPSANVASQVTYAGGSVPAYGTGTLGTVEAPIGVGSAEKDTLKSSAFLELSVDTARRGEDRQAPNAPNRAPVQAQAILNAGQLAMDASEGTLLHRSQVELFEGLARRPLSGIAVGGTIGEHEGRVIDPRTYDPIPVDCQGANCPYEVPLQYTFTSSDPEVGGFVLHEASSAEPTMVRLNSKHEPIPDEPRDQRGELTPNGRFVERENRKDELEAINENGEPIPRESSALFCAYNAGTTTITLTAGGLSYSMPITVQGGSPVYPCGTVPLKHPPPRYEESTTPIGFPNVTPQPALTPFTPHFQNLVPPPAPIAPAPAPAPVTVHHPLPTPAAKPQPAPIQQLPSPSAPVAISYALVPPAPALPQLTPPSGTAQVPAQSPVAEPAVAPEREEEHETATQHVHNMAAYTHPNPAGHLHPAGEPGEEGSPPGWPLALIVIAAAAGAGIRRRRSDHAHAWAPTHRGGR
ncbi:MAG: hypothetical protein FWD42_10430, partial [Solirubrobacterales bacterium]|nr:hypothetical protein [Solirubrobacterales bacterium]